MRARKRAAVGDRRPLFNSISGLLSFRPYDGRGERIRTSGPCLPKTVLYQAELLPAAADDGI
jgi:hypothetical protein